MHLQTYTKEEIPVFSRVQQQCNTKNRHEYYQLSWCQVVVQTSLDEWDWLAQLRLDWEAIFWKQRAMCTDLKMPIMKGVASYLMRN